MGRVKGFLVRIVLMDRWWLFLVSDIKFQFGLFLKWMRELYGLS